MPGSRGRQLAGMSAHRVRAVICIAGIVGGLVMLMLALTANASPGTTISVSSSSTTVGGDTTITVSVNLAAADAEFRGFEIALTWDSTIATAAFPASIAPAASFSLQTGLPDLVNGPGQLDVVGAKFGGDPPCNTGVACALFTVTFHGVANGQATITAGPAPDGRTSLSDGDGLAITTSFGSGTITVGSGGNTPPSTATSTNTATNTPTKTNTPPNTATPQTPGTTQTPPTTQTPGTTTTPTVTATATPGTQTPSATTTASATGTRTPSPTPTKTATPSPTPTKTPVGTGHQYVVPQLARDGAS